MVADDRTELGSRASRPSDLTEIRLETRPAAWIVGRGTLALTPLVASILLVLDGVRGRWEYAVVEGVVGALPASTTPRVLLLLIAGVRCRLSRLLGYTRSRLFDTQLVLPPFGRSHLPQHERDATGRRDRSAPRTGEALGGRVGSRLRQPSRNRLLTDGSIGHVRLDQPELAR